MNQRAISAKSTITVPEMAAQEKAMTKAAEKEESKLQAESRDCIKMKVA